jgi:hypothetical protein
MIRTSTAQWNGTLKQGSGTLGTQSKVLSDHALHLPLALCRRQGNEPGGG